MASDKVRGAGKPASTSGVKSQGVAAKVAEKASKAGTKAKKLVKDHSPSSSEADDDESEEESSEDEEMADTSDSSESSEAEAESKPAAKSNGIAQANGKAKAIAQDNESDDDSEEDESESDDEVVPTNNADAVSKAPVTKAAKGEEEDESEDESDSDEEAAPAVVGKPVKSAPTKTKDESEDDSEDEESTDEENDEDATKEAKPKGAVDAQALSGALSKVSGKEESGANSSSEEETGSGSESDDSEESSSEEEEEKKPAPQKKRKADERDVPASKKTKVEENANSSATNNLFVGSLSWNVDDEWLRREFETFGELKSCRVITTPEGKSKGFGYVEFVEVDAAIKAHDEMKDQEIDGRRANVDWAPRKQGFNQQDRSKRFGDQRSEPSSTLWVGNVSFGANEDMLREAFGEYGSIVGIRLPTDKETGEIKGFGFVEFGSVEEATSAIDAMSGMPIAGRPLRLDFDQPRAGGGGVGNRGGARRGGFGGDRRGGFGGDRRGGGMPGGNWRGSRGSGPRGGRGGGSTNRGGFGDFKGTKVTF